MKRKQSLFERNEEDEPKKRTGGNRRKSVTSIVSKESKGKDKGKEKEKEKGRLLGNGQRKIGYIFRTRWPPPRFRTPEAPNSFPDVRSALAPQTSGNGWPNYFSLVQTRVVLCTH
jgi:hypothetical protein